MHRRAFTLLVGAFVPATLVVAGPVGPAHAAPLTVRASVDSNEQQFDEHHDYPAISANGRYVAFEGGPLFSLYVRDLVGGVTQLISDENASDPDISADGNLVAFVSIANLAPPASGPIFKIYVFNRSTSTFELVSLNATGTDSAEYHSYNPTMSANGVVIAFESDGDDLVAGDTNEKRDVFVRDRGTGTNELISVSSAEVLGNGVSQDAAVSANGRFVAFESDATNLVPGDTNGKTDVFVRDRLAGTTQRVGLDSAETQGNDFSNNPDISANGQFVAFDSKANNWPGSTGSVLTYVRDRLAGTTDMVSVSSAEVVADNRFGSGDPAISDNGRFVSFSSNAGNLVPGDTGNDQDVFLRDRAAGTTRQVSLSTSGVQSNGGVNRSPAIAGTAAVPVIAFVSDATNLVPGDTNGDRDIFARKVA